VYKKQQNNIKIYCKQQKEFLKKYTEKNYKTFVKIQQDFEKYSTTKPILE